MQISVRSSLTAGLVAVVGVGTIALAPVESGALSPLAVPIPAVADVTLAALTLPFTDIVSLLQTLGIGGAIPDITSLVPADFANAIATEFLNQATPLVTAAATDVFAYFNSTVAGLFSGPTSIPARFGGALGAIPVVLVTAVQALATGDLPTALQTLSTGLVAPITSIQQAVLDASQSFQSFVNAQINSVTLALPGVLLSAVSTVITNDLKSVLNVVQNAISALTLGLIPPAASVPAVAAVRATAGLAPSLPTPTASARASAVASPRPVAARHAAATVVSTAPVDTAPAVTLDRADAIAPVADAAPVAPKPGSRSRAGVRHAGKAASDAAPAASRRTSSRTG
jgi:hypothetical protein